MEAIWLHEEPTYIHKFITFPKKLYTKAERTHNPQEERALLKGEHVLSKYFVVEGIIIIDEKKEVLARAMVTSYPQDDTAYVGFFESIHDEKVSKMLFEEVRRFCQRHEKAAIVGPVDASFWIKYRLKVNAFGAPYTGEPYNKTYYLELFQKSGYEIIETYTSNYFSVVQKEDDNTKYLKRLAQKQKEGYKITSPRPDNFEEALGEIYDLLIDLYSDFPIFKAITKEEFVQCFSPLKKIIDYDMVKLAYFQERIVGFFISIPDYNNQVYGTLTPIKLAKILRIRRKPKAYIMLYMGVDRKHIGLGRALTQKMKNQLQIKQVPSIGALMRQGKVTAYYYKELVTSQYEYVLLSYKIKGERLRKIEQQDVKFQSLS